MKIDHPPVVMVSTGPSLIRRRMQICKRGGMSKPLAPPPILVKHPLPQIVVLYRREDLVRRYVGGSSVGRGHPHGADLILRDARRGVQRGVRQDVGRRLGVVKREEDRS